MKPTLRVEGELYLRLETVAEIYEVQVRWLHEVHEAGLLGRAHRDAPRCIAAAQLDRVATLVRLHRVLGSDLDAMRRALDAG